MRQVIGFLAILFIAGGFTAVFQGIGIIGTVVFEVATALAKVSLPTSIFDVITMHIENTWTLTNVHWVDTSLLWIASLGPSIVTFGLTKFGLKLPVSLSGLISLIVFVGVLQLFSAPIFWIVLGVLVIGAITVTIIGKINENRKLTTI